MREKRKLDFFSYPIMLKICINLKDKAWAQKLLQEMDNDYIYKDVVTYNTLFNLCVALKDKAWAQELLQEMDNDHIYKDLVTYNTLFNLCVALKDKAWAQKLLEEMNNDHIYKDEAIYTVILKFSLVTNDNVLFEKIYNEIETLKIEKTPGICISLFKYYAAQKGVPLPLAKKHAGDYDGDRFNIGSLTNLSATAQMIKDEEKTARQNHKVTKTNTPRKPNKTGNYAQMVEMRFPLLERWTGVNKAIQALSIDNQMAIAGNRY